MPPFLFGGCVLVGQIYFVYVKGFVGLYDCRTGGHIPFNVKSVFLVEVGKVFVVRVLRYIVLIAEKGAQSGQYLPRLDFGTNTPPHSAQRFKSLSR